MNRFEILKNYPSLSKNVHYLEEEGKTVVILVINKIPQLILALEETHLAKPESRQVIQYLQDVMKLRVCMITGDNKHSAYKVGRYLGIPQENITSRAYPHEKR